MTPKYTRRSLARLSSLLLLASVGAAQSTFLVNTTADTVDANPGDGICADSSGQCSLRAAIQEANASGSASITLQANATYSLTRMGAGEDGCLTGDLDVTGSVNLLGRGSVVDALNSDRAFDVLAPGRMRAQNLVVRNGRVTDASGGGYRSNNILHLVNTLTTNCTATGAGASGGAVFNNGGTLLSRASGFSGGSATRAGGAIEANAGTTTIIGSTLLNNMTGPMPGNGGGFHLTGTGTVSVMSTDVINNVASAEGGGLWNSAVGTMDVTGCRILTNQALGTDATNGGGGLFNDGGTLTVSTTTISGNQAGMGSGSGGGVFNDGGSFSISRSKVSGNSAMRAGGGFEARAGTTTIFNTAVFANQTGAAPGNGGGLHLSGAGTVEVGLSEFYSNTAAAEGGGLWNSSGGTMTIAGSMIRDNVASGADPDQGGGGIFNDGGDLTVSNSVLSSNVADGASGSGGGGLNNGGILAVSNTRFEDNSAQRAGGGIEANGGTTDLDGVHFRRNACGPAPGNGGAFHLTGMGLVNIDNGSATDNTASAEGGAFWNSGAGTMNIASCDIERNTASGDGADQGGGGVFNQGGVMTITGGVISDNVADGAAGSGGGILNDLGDLTVSMTSIFRNVSQRAGGGIEANVGNTTLLRVRLGQNSTGASPGNGGGLHLTGAGTVTVDESSVALNFAANEGGGLWNSASGTMVVTATRTQDNTSPAGADVFNDGGTFTVDGQPVPVGP